MRNLLEDRIEYGKRENVFFVDYERARLDPVPMFHDFAKWLVDSNELPPQISYTDLEEAAKRGTFTYQSEGRVKEGEREEFHNSGGWMRKGIVGDWKNHFSPEIKSYFKDRAGDLLIEAGYERNNDW